MRTARPHRYADATLPLATVALTVKLKAISSENKKTDVIQELVIGIDI